MSCAGTRATADADHLEIEGARECCKARSDATQADDDEGPAAEFLLARRRIGDHARPAPLVLVVARLPEMTGHGKDKGDRMLGHDPFVRALGACEPDAAALQDLARELVRARADGLDEAQPRRGLGIFVSPQERREKNIRLRQGGLQLVGSAGNDHALAGLRGEGLGEPVCRMSDADHLGLAPACFRHTCAPGTILPAAVSRA
jgi:hypothetical protein